MDLNALNADTMLNLSGAWLRDTPQNEFLIGMKQAGLLAEGFLQRIHKSHARLLDADQARRDAEEELRKIIERTAALDQLHDRKVRAVNHHLDGLIEGADELADVEDYQRLRAELLPDGIRFIRHSYIEEGGAAVSIEHRIGEQTRAKLEQITVGEQTLADLFVAWVEAGKQLGEAMKRRAALEAALGRDGSKSVEVDVQAARFEWIKTVRGLLWALENEELMLPLAEGVIAAIEQGITISQRRRAAGEGEFGDDGEDGGEDGQGGGAGGGGQTGGGAGQGDDQAQDAAPEA